MTTVDSNARVTLLTADGERMSDTAMGNGPVDATFKAILRIVQLPVKLTQCGAVHARLPRLRSFRRVCAHSLT